MDFLALCPRGIEDFATAEATELGLKASPDVAGAISGTVKDLKALLSFTYRTRTCNKVVLVLARGKFSEDPVEEVPLDSEALAPWLADTFSITAERRGEHPFSSQDLVTQLGALISERTGKTMRFKGAKTQFFALAHESTFVFGIDLTGFDLGRRDFRVFLRAESLRGTVAAALLRIAGWEPKHTLLDPFCRDGVIPIEAALTATNRSPHFYAKDSFAWRTLPEKSIPSPDSVLTDKEIEVKGKIISLDENFGNVSAAKRNATVAGVVKDIDFSRFELEWVDTKFEKNSIDRIITYPPEVARMVTEQKIAKIYSLFFERAAPILKKTGSITTIVRRSGPQLKEAAAKHGFALAQERIVYAGNEPMTVLVFTRR